MNVADALSKARSILNSNAELAARGTVESEAEQIVMESWKRIHGVRLPRAELYARAQEEFSSAAWSEMLSLSSLRAEGRLLQHLIGSVQFLEHEYQVGPDVLVPRPETEGVVLQAIQLVKQHGFTKGIEIGLGSGVISIELLSRFPGLEMIASELSEHAERRAVENARAILGKSARRLTVVRAQSPLEVWEPFTRECGAETLSCVSFLVMNPPYLLPTSSEVDEEVRTEEPAQALFAPESDVLYFYRQVAAQVKSVLPAATYVIAEIPHERAQAIAGLFEARGWKTECIEDLAGRPRVLVASPRISTDRF